MENQTRAVTLKSSEENVYIFHLMGRELTVVYDAENKKLKFSTKDANFMNLIKKHVHGKSQMKSQHVKVSVDAMMEYTVIYLFYIFMLISVVMYLFRFFSSFVFFRMLTIY